MVLLHHADLIIIMSLRFILQICFFHQEYVSQLSLSESWSRLCEVLCSWPVFEHLYHDEYSPQLLVYWRQASGGGGGAPVNGEGEVTGGAALMRDSYRAALADLEGQEPRDEEQLAIRYEQVARIL